MTTLTEAERTELRQAVADAHACTGSRDKWFEHVEPIVEAIVAARLASVEALADEPTAPYPAECGCSHGMGFQFHRFPCRYAVDIPKSALRAVLGSDAQETIARTLAHHIARDQYDDDGNSVGTYCTCGGWTGDYFADGEAGPFDDHLADMLVAALAGQEQP